MMRRKKEKKIRREGPIATARRPFVNSRVVTLYYVRRIRCVVVFEILYELYSFHRIFRVVSFTVDECGVRNLPLFFSLDDDDDGSETEILFSIARR